MVGLRMILMLGASGFIGREVAARLLSSGYSVRAGARDFAALSRRMPGLNVFECDLNRIRDPSFWLPHLDGVFAVINCAGVLVAYGQQDIVAIHRTGPVSLFAACEEVGVRRIVHLSIPSTNFSTGTAYADTKLGVEQDLATRDLDWLILRPSLAVGRGAHGGTALLRAIAASPVPLLPGAGDQEFSPISLDDLAEVVVAAISDDAPVRQALDLGGPEVLTLAQIVRQLRAWLGVRAHEGVHIPGAWVRGAARMGDLTHSTILNTTMVLQMEAGNAVSAEATSLLLGRSPETLDTFLARCPSQTQDRWHARLFLLRPVLRAALAMVWLTSGLIGVLSSEAHALMAAATNMGEDIARMTSIGMGLIDLVVAGLIVGPFDRLRVDQFQFLMVSAYSLVAISLLPTALADPLGGVLKNLAVLATVLVCLVIAEDR